MRNEYGRFTEDGREFATTRQDTPLPWVSQTSNDEYCMLISQTGGGYSFVHGSGYDRILRALPGEQVSVDRPGATSTAAMRTPASPGASTGSRSAARCRSGSTATASSFGEGLVLSPAKDPAGAYRVWPRCRARARARALTRSEHE